MSSVFRSLISDLRPLISNRRVSVSPYLRLVLLPSVLCRLTPGSLFHALCSMPHALSCAGKDLDTLGILDILDISDVSHKCAGGCPG